MLFFEYVITCIILSLGHKRFRYSILCRVRGSLIMSDRVWSAGLNTILVQDSVVLVLAPLDNTTISIHHVVKHDECRDEARH